VAAKVGTLLSFSKADLGERRADDIEFKGLASIYREPQSFFLD